MKKTKIFVAHPLRQMIWRHMASYCCLSDGRQYQHLISVINLLRKIVGETEIRKHFGNRYDIINQKLIDFEKLINHVAAFCALIERKDYRDTSFYNDKFRLYFSSLQKLPLIHQEVLEVFVFLLNETTMCQTTIPSSYIAQASQELIFETAEETRRDRSFVSKRERRAEEEGYIDEEELKLEEPEDDED